MQQNSILFTSAGDEKHTKKAHTPTSSYAGFRSASSMFYIHSTQTDGSCIYACTDASTDASTYTASAATDSSSCTSISSSPSPPSRMRLVAKAEAYVCALDRLKHDYKRDLKELEQEVQVKDANTRIKSRVATAPDGCAEETFFCWCDLADYCQRAGELLLSRFQQTIPCNILDQTRSKGFPVHTHKSRALSRRPPSQVRSAQADEYILALNRLMNDYRRSLKELELDANRVSSKTVSENELYSL